MDTINNTVVVSKKKAPKQKHGESMDTINPVVVVLNVEHSALPEGSREMLNSAAKAQDTADGLWLSCAQHLHDGGVWVSQLTPATKDKPNDNYDADTHQEIGLYVAEAMSLGYLLVDAEGKTLSKADWKGKALESASYDVAMRKWNRNIKTLKGHMEKIENELVETDSTRVLLSALELIEREITALRTTILGLTNPNRLDINVADASVYLAEALAKCKGLKTGMANKVEFAK